MNQIYSLESLFTKRIFRIPDYQRGYSWDKQQLKEFWDDLSILLRDRFHYTGMISLRELDRKEILQREIWNDERWLVEQKFYGIYHVVDGQQRLTTCIILINEIVKFVRNLEENKDKDLDRIYLNSTRLSDIIEKYLLTIKPDSENQLITYNFGYEVDNPSYEYFKNCILNDNMQVGINETFYTLKLLKAKEFFAEEIAKVYKVKGYKEIEDIFFKLTQKMMFNLYDIDDDVNVFVAFETMNNRGNRLSTLELLKNRLIYLTTLFNDVSEDVKNATRIKINNTWKTIYGYLGQNKEKSLNDDEFLQAHWITYFGYTKTGQEAYVDELLNKYFSQKRIINDELLEIDEDENDDDDEIDEEIDINEVIENTSLKKDKLTIGDIGRYVDSLEQMIPYWYIINFPKSTDKVSKEIQEWLSKLNRIGYAYFKPLTAVILSKQDVLESDKIKALQLIERFIFLHFRLSGFFQTYRTSTFYNLAHYLYVNDKDILEVIDMLDDIDSDIMSANNILKINSAKNKFSKLFNYKGYYSWNYLKYFLYEYEMFLMNNQANQKIYPEQVFKKDEKYKVSIEHIYPQTDTKEYWKERFDKYTSVEKKYLVGSLGNLLPLSLIINARLQNDSFDDKKDDSKRTRGYRNGSHCEMEVAKNEEWTAENILNRGLKLLEFMEDRWDFKFKSKRDKVSLLFLDFLVKDDEGYYKDDIELEMIEKEVEIKRDRKSNYTEDDLIKNSTDENIELFKYLDKKILEINSEINKHYTKHYIGYRFKNNIAEVKFRNDYMVIYLLPFDGETDAKITNVPESYNFTLNRRITVYTKEDVDIVVEHIRKTYIKYM